MENLQPVIDLIREIDTWRILVVPSVIMAVDYLTGFLKALINKNVVSSKLREGLIKKSGECLIIVMFVFLQYAIGIPKEITLAVASYIGVMEMISICENLGEIGVPIPKFLKDRLECLTKEE